MKISARVRNTPTGHEAELATGGVKHALAIPQKTNGRGSSANGGELLFLALATCYCNDIHREAAKRGLSVGCVEVEVEGEFGAEGEPARNIRYRARVTADAPEAVILDMMRRVDAIAEVHNTLRGAAAVTLESAAAARS